MTSPRTRLQPAARRESILAAARDIFVAESYETASMEAIAREAQVTPGLVNHYFGTKREIYLAVVEDLAGELPKMISTEFFGLPRAEMVARNMNGFLDAFEANFEVWSMLIGAQGGVGRDPEVTALMAGARDEIVARMARNHVGDDPPEELLLALRAFQGAAETAASEWLRRGRASREQVHALLTKTLLAMVSNFTPTGGPTE